MILADAIDVETVLIPGAHSAQAVFGGQQEIGTQLQHVQIHLSLDSSAKAHFGIIILHLHIDESGGVKAGRTHLHAQIRHERKVAGIHVFIIAKEQIHSDGHFHIHLGVSHEYIVIVFLVSGSFFYLHPGKFGVDGVSKLLLQHDSGEGVVHHQTHFIHPILLTNDDVSIDGFDVVIEVQFFDIEGNVCSDGSTAISPNDVANLSGNTEAEVLVKLGIKTDIETVINVPAIHFSGVVIDCCAGAILPTDVELNGIETGQHQ